MQPEVHGAPARDLADLAGHGCCAVFLAGVWLRLVGESQVSMLDVELESGPLASEKGGDTSDPAHSQPNAAEVESARLLATSALPAFRARGLEEDEVERLAGEYIALDLGADTDGFISSAERQRG
jgi:hypothetical protein